MASALLLLVGSALAGDPSLEVLVLGASERGPGELLVRLRPGGPVLRPVRASERCRAEPQALARVVQAAFQQGRSIDRVRVRIDPARLRPGLDPRPCRDPTGWLARALDRASSGSLEIAARTDAPTSRLEVRLEQLRSRPLAYAWTEIRASANERAVRPAWSAARTDPLRVLGWLLRAGLVARSWSERTAAPETAREWAWPWITLTLLGGLPIAALAWAQPQTSGAAIAVALAGAGVILWLSRLEPPSGALAALPLAGALASRLRQGRGRLLALVALLPLAALALEGDGPALFLLPIAAAWSRARGTRRTASRAGAATHEELAEPRKERRASVRARAR